jgi:hypothetical protein
VTGEEGLLVGGLPASRSRTEEDDFLVVPALVSGHRCHFDRPRPPRTSQGGSFRCHVPLSLPRPARTGTGFVIIIRALHLPFRNSAGVVTA